MALRIDIYGLAGGPPPAAMSRNDNEGTKMQYRYYRKHGKLYQVWPRNTSFKDTAEEKLWSWTQLAEELDQGVVLIPVAL